MDETRSEKILAMAQNAAYEISKEARDEVEFALWIGLVHSCLDKYLLVLRMSEPSFANTIDAKRERNAILKGAPHA